MPTGAAIVQRRYEMNGKSQMQGGKSWILPKKVNANQFFRDTYWLETWKNPLFTSMGPNGGSLAMDSASYSKCIGFFPEQYPSPSLYF
jgi:hypothetical protein